MYFTKTLINNLNISNLLKKAVLKDSIFFDIETTGLNTRKAKIISITALVYSENFYMYQYFSETSEDERHLIEKFINLINTKKIIITYNGNSFDIPFINYKINNYKLNFNFKKFNKIDLFYDVKILKQNFKNLNNLKLKSIEEFFNIHRKDQLTGKDIIKLYSSYQLNNKKEYRNLILQHNYEDVIYLPIILDSLLLLYDDFFIIKYQDTNCIIKFQYSNILFTKKRILIKLFTLSKNSLDYSIYNSYFKLYWNSKKNIININIFPYYYNSDKMNDNLIYLLNEDITINNYEKIKELNNNIIPLKYSNQIYFKNINLLLEKIINSIK